MSNNFDLNELKVYEHHINCIYKCGMLVDEHVELLHEFWRLPKVDRSEISWTISALPLLCGGFFTFKMKSVLPLIVTSLPLGVKVLNCLFKRFQCKTYIRNFECLTNTLRNIFDFNKTSQKYYERRKGAINKLETSTKVLIEGPVIHKLTVFINTILVIMENVIVHIQKQLSILKEFIPSEFAHIFNLNLDGRISWFTEGDLISHFEMVQMCYVLAASTFLSGIGLALSRSPEYILKNIIATSETVIASNYYDMKNIFEDITFSLPETETSKSDRLVRTDSTVTIGKLIESLQLTFYTGLAVQECILKGNEEYVRAQLKDLEKLFTHSSNLLLILQYEHKDQTETAKSNFEEETVRNNFSVDGKIVRYDDDDERVDDQEFNLSIHGSDTEMDAIDDDANLEYEELREQVRVQKVIIKELNDELLKRKLIKEELVDQNKVCTGKKSESLSCVDHSFINPENLSFNNKDFLAQIKAVAQNRGLSELVFGDDVELDENESDEQ